MPNTFIFLIWKFILILIAIFSIFIFLLIHTTKKRCSDDVQTQENFLKKLIKHIFCLFIIVIIGALFSSLSLQFPIGTQNLFNKKKVNSNNSFATFPKPLTKGKGSLLSKLGNASKLGELSKLGNASKLGELSKLGNASKLISKK